MIDAPSPLDAAQLKELGIEFKQIKSKHILFRTLNESD